jgi:hypothetical protein
MLCECCRLHFHCLACAAAFVLSRDVQFHANSQPSGGAETLKPRSVLRRVVSLRLAVVLQPSAWHVCAASANLITPVSTVPSAALRSTLSILLLHCVAVDACRSGGTAAVCGPPADPHL